MVLILKRRSEKGRIKEMSLINVNIDCLPTELPHDFFRIVEAECLHCGTAETTRNQQERCPAREEHYDQQGDPFKTGAARRSWEETAG
jgi:hypothetical protein